MDNTNQKSLREVLIEAAEALDWSCVVEEYSNGNFLRFGKYSPAGEDFSISVSDNPETIVREVIKVAENFDVDEHVELWLDARKSGVSGVPNSIRDLLEDAEAIQEMLCELSDKLSEAATKFEQHDD